MPILTSVVIECDRAGLKNAAYQHAVTLMKPENRNLLDDKYRKKIESIVRRPPKGFTDAEEDLTPCPFCQAPIPSTLLTCVQCQQPIPICIVTVCWFRCEIFHHSFETLVDSYTALDSLRWLRILMHSFKNILVRNTAIGSDHYGTLFDYQTQFWKSDFLGFLRNITDFA